jgi:glycosyltransferase involved in cell wall biosynthesis
MMPTGQPTATAVSTSWPSATPAVSVVIATHERAGYLGELHDALAAQANPPEFEVVVADDGSADGTWSALDRLAARSPLPFKALRLPASGGASIPRNTAVAESRGAVVAFTDDDCLPSPGWLRALVAGFDDRDVAVVQGRTAPEPGGWEGPWSRSLEVSGLSGLYEGANLACRRDAFVAVGGFNPHRVVAGRPFGEDVQLGIELSRNGAARFAEAAVVHHRVMPGSYRQFIEERRRLAGFPALVREVPELRRQFVAGVFLSRRTLAVDAAVAGAVAAVSTATAWPVVASLPWLARCWQAAAERPGRPRPVRAAQLAVADLVGLGALVRGSVEAHRVVL